MVCSMDVVVTLTSTLFLHWRGMGMGSGVSVSPPLFFSWFPPPFAFFSCFSFFSSFFHHSANTDGFGREACNVYVFMACCVLCVLCVLCALCVACVGLIDGWMHGLDKVAASQVKVS